ncbi:DUF393 domain-containing protein [Termitidicoccus mucosus]|uniref:thiol-disulfide oxidoreductase DCC family protein n=1 Tax=Termitidicoccus mucosus TaxID=1184151 RepID=UPI002FEE4C60
MNIHRPSGPAGGRAAALLLYDDECGLCRWCVRRLARADRRGALRFARLSGATAAAFWREAGFGPDDPKPDSMVLVLCGERDGTRSGYFLRTGAIWRALSLAGGVWHAAAWCVRIWPPSWRDAVYRLVARMRRRLVRGPGPDPAADANLSERFLP